MLVSKGLPSFSMFRKMLDIKQMLQSQHRFMGMAIRKAEKIYVKPVKASELTKENLPLKADRGCPICSRGIKFTHKDVPFLSQFMTSDGKMLNRRLTGVCKTQQKILQKKINIARRLSILPNFTKINEEIKK